MSEFEETEKLTTAADFQVLTDDINVLRGFDLGEGLTLRFVINNEL